MFVTVFSSLRQPPACQIFSLGFPDNSNNIDSIRVDPMGWLLEPREESNSDQPRPGEFPSPEIFSHNLINGGDTIYGMVFKPHNMVPGKRYPVVVSVYGGPEVQLVTNSYKVSLFKLQVTRPDFESPPFCYRVIDKFETIFWRPKAISSSASTRAARRTAAWPSNLT